MGEEKEKSDDDTSCSTHNAADRTTRTVWKDLCKGAQRLQSKQHRQEAIDIYKQALTLWPHETELKHFQNLFQL